ncbi:MULTISPECIES: winged helix-turn-helix transcriptional regulator [unclassified Variovorax]|jgi:DNA-binding response OmpR family regulator|uniref:winged helix-turn-helix transcriptional regulator n=1 Tax=unclassified Variovorax TaxID=663243 RepID=UPI0008ED29CB|nr:MULTISPECIES: response regulator transcription factor [unclassified Variovorax]TAJ60814.1 MAG: response regulator transcription factor [Variovorax sp.]SFP65978.1 DNA-binding response regulator, OmpR family, contains REC and winged-helix (wHTH) domain [Variovorax sp. PDC80]
MSPTTNAGLSNPGSISSLALVFGDDRNRGALRDALDSQGFASAAFDSVQNLWDSLSSGRRYDALIACADKAWSPRRWVNLRSMVKLPILVVVSRDALELASTFDDESINGERIEFATAPVDGAELAMRLRLLHSRRNGTNAPPVEEDLIWGSFHFKRQARVVLVDGVEVRLQPREFEVALILFQNLGKVIGRAEIEAQLFDRPASPGSRVLDVHVTRVRRKLSLGPEKGVRLLTIYGVGYRLVALNPPSEARSG